MSPSFTERELDLLRVLWNAGSGTVAEVRDGLQDDPAYSTVLTLLRKMEGKGLVRHEEEGRAYRWFPAVERREAGETALERMVDGVFGGSTRAFLAHLVSSDHATRHDLLHLRELVDERLGESAGSAG